MEDIFSECHIINDFLGQGEGNEARNRLILLLDYHERNSISYSPIINHLIRQVGLFPYMEPESSHWSDEIAYRSFEVNAGAEKDIVLHLEQANILGRLLEGESIALSAPTSFGKSFIIDSFIKIKSPNNVLIIVPTLALADETRRRLQSKFGRQYAVVTSTEQVKLGERNIFVFPQERAISFERSIPNLDLFVVDEFYKASAVHDTDRAGALIRAILKFSERATQRYFLAPNIARLEDNPFTRGMEFIPLNFNTVVLQETRLFERIGKNKLAKNSALVDVLRGATGKTLIYAGTYSGIKEVAIVLQEALPVQESGLRLEAREWIESAYGPNWVVPHLMARGVGVHNGQLHRSLSQVQIKLFEEEGGLDVLVSTSSIIEGVNTSAENVVLWKNKIGNHRLTDFQYRNIIGRGGRMFRHFVGHIYVLEEPPVAVENQLELELPESLLVFSDVQKAVGELSDEQRESISSYNDSMRGACHGEIPDFAALPIQTSDADVIRKIALGLHGSPNNWNGLGHLNSDNVDSWDWTLYKVLELAPGAWDAPYKKFVAFVKASSKGWERSIPELLDDLAEFDIDIDLFFKLERNLTFKLAALIGDINTISHSIYGDQRPDVSPFVFRASNAFLPPLVFQLEEYGLPRMLSKKLHLGGLIDLLDSEKSLSQVLEEFRSIQRGVMEHEGLLRFERYMLQYFFDGLG